MADWTPEERLEFVQDSIEAVFWSTRRLLGAKTITDQGDALNDLNNEVDQLVTWHDRYNWETGEIDE